MIPIFPFPHGLWFGSKSTINSERTDIIFYIAILLWNIWFARNASLFENKSLDMINILSTSCRLFKEIKAAADELKVNEGVAPASFWTPPPWVALKLIMMLHSLLKAWVLVMVLLLGMKMVTFCLPWQILILNPCSWMLSNSFGSDQSPRDGVKDLVLEGDCECYNFSQEWYWHLRLVH